MMLKNNFTTLLLNYTNDTGKVEKYWHELETAYSHSKRKYHNLSHLENMFEELEEVKDKVEDQDTIVFAIFYHDIIYNVLKGNNEAKSAAIAVERLSDIGLDSLITTKCKEHILATKHHVMTSSNDTNILIDIDMSILGKEWSIYEKYMSDVRSEYSIYPDFVYNKGRKNALIHFLDNNVFLTPYFYEKYEKQAIRNIKREIEILRK
ncbi:HD domain-containing protein [Flammeovirga aprica]|uniref:Metal-dependent HD superfamily phosphohydrolase n=1 Tax=Flammeovirga aprica JL-4 TaxID=694437 RepID=A0A7X9P2T1_9BACT|nr:hypothetical protein [Flammeovirga aprica]NME67604.1 hypothetical protein [Flammeovirga aprica JL-4]